MGCGGNADLEMATYHNRQLKRQVEKAGEELLKETMQSPKFPYRMANMPREQVINNQDFLGNNACYCIAYVKEAKVVEVYKVFTHLGYGCIELVNVEKDVKQMPKWRNIRVQVS